MSETTRSDNKYLYNGKELQDEQLGGINLDLYDYNLRFYDPALARFTTQDPLAEEFSSWTPYHYVHNNPINLVDPTGMSATKYEDEEGNTLLNTDDGSDAVVTVTDDKRQGFDAAVKGTKNTDDVDWNKSMKAYALGFSLSDKQEAHLSKLNSDWSRKGAINYWQNESVGSGLSFGIKEVLSQWTNPELVVTGVSAGVAGYSAVIASRPVPGVRNSSLAGKTHATGVKFNRQGFPNFKGHLYQGGPNNVRISSTGARGLDAAAANKAAGYGSTPKGYVWHHHQQPGRMQLVNRDIHSATGHTGGFTLWNQ